MLWRLPSGVLFRSVANPGGGAQRVETGEGATPAGPEVFAVDEGTQGGDQVGSPAEHPGEGTPVPRPSETATKAEWVAYLTDLGYGPESVNVRTKAELIELADTFEATS